MYIEEAEKKAKPEQTNNDVSNYGIFNIATMEENRNKPNINILEILAVVTGFLLLAMAGIRFLIWACKKYNKHVKDKRTKRQEALRMLVENRMRNQPLAVTFDTPGNRQALTAPCHPPPPSYHSERGPVEDPVGRLNAYFNNSENNAQNGQP